MLLTNFLGSPQCNIIAYFCYIFAYMLSRYMIFSVKVHHYMYFIHVWQFYRLKEEHIFLAQAGTKLKCRIQVAIHNQTFHYNSTKSMSLQFKIHIIPACLQCKTVSFLRDGICIVNNKSNKWGVNQLEFFLLQATKVRRQMGRFGPEQKFHLVQL